MIELTTHVLDTSQGQPAEGVKMTLSHWDDGHWQVLEETYTDADGRVTKGVFPILTQGRYQLTASIGEWFDQQGKESLYINAQLDVELDDGVHYHLPFLITPWSWSTYRGS